MPRPSKITVKKTVLSRPLRKLSPQRPKPLSTFYFRFKRWMFAVFRAINLPPKRTNILRKRSSTQSFSGFKSLNPSPFNTPRILRPQTAFERTIEIISAIEKAVIIVALVTRDFQAPLKLLESIQTIYLLRTTAIATSYWSKRVET